MAPLAPNLTDRLWLKYTSFGKAHEMVFRFDAAVPQADQVAVAADFAQALKIYMASNDSFLSVRHQDAGSTVSFPLAFTPVAGTGTPYQPQEEDKAQFASITGRSLDGVDCRLTFFSTFFAYAAKYRSAAGVEPVGTALRNAALAAEPALQSASGGDVLWNGYTNMGYNAYWQRQLRKG